MKGTIFVAKKKRKYTAATKTYRLKINETQAQTLKLFKILRPDFKNNQEIMDYACKLFVDNFDDMFLTTYLWLDSNEEHYTKVVLYRYYSREKKLIDSRVEALNRRFKTNLTYAEYFRKILLFLFYEYQLLDPMEEQPLLQELPEDLYGFIKDLDPAYQKEIISAWELNDDKSLDKENEDDITLKVENEDDITLEVENEDDISLEVENTDDISSQYEYYDDYTLDLENY